MGSFSTRCPAWRVKVPARLQPHIPKSTSVYLVLLWMLLTHVMYNHTVFNIGHIRFGNNPVTIYLIGVSQIVSLLLFPLMGLVGEIYWTRYKIMITGTITALLSVLIAPVAFVVLKYVEDSDVVGAILISILLLPLQVGLAMFQANAIQFGTDQLVSASSDELSSFIHWLFWTLYLFPAFVSIFACLIESNPLTVAPLIQVIALVVAVVVFLLPCTRRRLETSAQTTRTNPIKLIWQVIEHWRKHKYPVNRSAFTYNDEENTSRINLAKERFGGPLTTDEVESVKTFGRIMFIFLSLFGFLLIDNTSVLIDMYDNIEGTSSKCIVVNNFTAMFMVVVVGVPVYKLLLTPFLHKYLPNMIKRMGLGLAAIFLSLTAQTIYAFYLNKATGDSGYIDICGMNSTSTSTAWYYNITDYDPPLMLVSKSVLLVPQLLNGLGLLLTFLTVLEFILAQAPRNMQGLLVGLWYALQAINALSSTIKTIGGSGCSYISYAVKAGLVLLSIICYLLAASWYKGRVRQEQSNIQERTIIEEYTARALDHVSKTVDYEQNGSYTVNTVNHEQ